MMYIKMSTITLLIKLILMLITIGSVFCGTYDDPNTYGNRQTLVQFFEWKWVDIANECETFLQHYGYGAVQISPPNEHLTMEQGNNRPWWIRYQPVSYKLQSRSGTQAQLVDMIKRCNAVGVRIIADAVLNHMVGVGQQSGVDGKGSTANTGFNGLDGVESFPGVAYGPNHFNDRFCHADISNYGDPVNVRECRLVGLLDLNQGLDYVRGKMRDYLNSLYTLGVAGIRMDAAKHMWPHDLKAVLAMTNNVNSNVFGDNKRPFVVQEVIDLGGEPITASQYVDNGRTTNFKYGADLASAVRKSNNNFKYFANFGSAWGMVADNDAVVFVDNHDNQRSASGNPITYKEPDLYVMATAYMLAWNYGLPRVMSSYYFTDKERGPPSTGSPNFYTNGPTFNQDATCNPNSGWVCEHRWPAIRNMAKFRSVVSGQGNNNIVTDDHRIAFSRGNKGFFAVNNQDGTWSTSFQTGLPSGTYCDVISGRPSTNGCSGTSVNVGENGRTNIQIQGKKTFAIHAESKSGTSSGQFTTNLPAQGSTLNPQGKQKTVIFLHKHTSPGQDLFLRGGIGHQNRPATAGDGCSIGIEHETSIAPALFSSYQSWAQGDHYLDWYGAEKGQGKYLGRKANGTPLFWSTNANGIGHQPLNTFGQDYWMVEVFMDCSNTKEGWFEAKGYWTGPSNWEPDANQGQCTGTVGGLKPFPSRNHVGRCGHINVFKWADSSCQIDGF